MQPVQLLAMVASFVIFYTPCRIITPPLTIPVASLLKRASVEKWVSRELQLLLLQSDVSLVQQHVLRSARRRFNEEPHK